MTLNYIWWWGYTSGSLNAEYLFIVITTMSFWAEVVVAVRFPIYMHKLTILSLLSGPLWLGVEVPVRPSS